MRTLILPVVLALALAGRAEAESCDAGTKLEHIQGLSAACKAAYRQYLNNTILQDALGKMTVAAPQTALDECGAAMCDPQKCVISGDDTCRCEWTNSDAFLTQCHILGGEPCIASSVLQWANHSAVDLAGQSYLCLPSECSASDLKLLLGVGDEICTSALTNAGLSDPMCSSDAFCPQSGTTTALPCKSGPNEYNVSQTPRLSPQCAYDLNQMQNSLSFQQAATSLQTEVGKEDTCSSGGVCTAAVACVEDLLSNASSTCSCEWYNTANFQIACSVLGGEICVSNAELYRLDRGTVTVNGARYFCRPLSCSLNDLQLLNDVYNTECTALLSPHFANIDCQQSISCPASGTFVTNSSNGVNTCMPSGLLDQLPTGLSSQCAAQTADWAAKPALMEAAAKLQTPTGKFEDCSLGAVCDPSSCLTAGHKDCPCTWSNTESYDNVCDVLDGVICITNAVITMSNGSTQTFNGGTYQCQPRSCAADDLVLKVAEVDVACTQAIHAIPGYEQATCHTTMTCPDTGVTVTATSPQAGLNCETVTAPFPAGISADCSAALQSWSQNQAYQEAVQDMRCSEDTLNVCSNVGICDTFSCAVEKHTECTCQWWNLQPLQTMCQTLGGSMCSSSVKISTSGYEGTVGGAFLGCFPSQCTVNDLQLLMGEADANCEAVVKQAEGASATCVNTLSCPSIGVEVTANEQNPSTCKKDTQFSPANAPGLSTTCAAAITSFIGDHGLQEAIQQLQSSQGTENVCDLGGTCASDPCYESGTSCTCSWSNTGNFLNQCNSLDGFVCTVDGTAIMGASTVTVKGDSYLCAPSQCTQEDLMHLMAYVNSFAESEMTALGVSNPKFNAVITCPTVGITASGTSAQQPDCTPDPSFNPATIAGVSPLCAASINSYTTSVPFQEAVTQLHSSRGQLNTCDIGGQCDVDSCFGGSASSPCVCSWSHTTSFLLSCHNMDGEPCTMDATIVAGGVTTVIKGISYDCLPTSCSESDVKALTAYGEQQCENDIKHKGGTGTCSFSMYCPTSGKGGSSSGGSASGNAGGNTNGGTTPKPSSHGSNAGAIIGGVIGGLCLIAVVCAMLYWYNHQKLGPAGTYYALEGETPQDGRAHGVEPGYVEYNDSRT